jgi:hypothetical protein
MTAHANPSGEVQDFGALDAYERNIQIHISDCEKHWHQVSFIEATCVVEIDKTAIVLDSQGLDTVWRYVDGSWDLQIALFHTRYGYRIQYIGNYAEPVEYYQFSVAKKYLQSMLMSRKSNLLRQVVLYSKQKPAADLKYLGPLVAVQRKFSLSDEAGWLEQCRQTWRTGGCFADFVRATRGEALLEDITLKAELNNLRHIYLQSESYKAWQTGNFFSDYKLRAGSSNKELSFGLFKTLFLNELAAKLPSEAALIVQKILGYAHAPTFVTDEPLGQIHMLQSTVQFNATECASTYRTNNSYKGRCEWRGAKLGYLIDDPNAHLLFTDWQNHKVTVWLRHEPVGFSVEAWGHADLVKSAAVFTQVVAQALSEQKPTNFYFKLNFR